MSYAVLIASLSITFIIAYVMFKLDVGGDSDTRGGNHFLLQLLMLFFIMGGLLLSGKAALDLDNDCLWIAPNVSTSNYTLYCEPSSATTGLSMFKGVLWFVRLVALYIFLYFVYRTLLYFNIIVKES